MKIYNTLINQENFTEKYIPPFFIGKYYVFKYLYDNEYFTEDNTFPSDDIYIIYKELYDFINSEFVYKENDSDEFITLKTDFIQSLPDREIITERQLLNKMNNKSEHNDMYNEPTGYSDSESDSGSDSDIDTVDSVDSFNDTEQIIINKIKSNILKYKNIKNNNKECDIDFIKEYKIIDYMYNEGFLDDLDIDDSISDYYCLYNTLLDYYNDKKIEYDVLEIFEDEINNFKDYIN